jgi:hypothetical protein
LWVLTIFPGIHESQFLYASLSASGIIGEKTDWNLLIF